MILIQNIGNALKFLVIAEGNGNGAFVGIFPFSYSYTYFGSYRKTQFFFHRLHKGFSRRRIVFWL